MQANIIMDLSKFIPYYLPPNDPGYIDDIRSKKEFHELLDNPNAVYYNDPFFDNWQAFIGRFMSPITNNKTILIRADTGRGKTRAAFSAALQHMKVDPKKRVMFLSNSKEIHHSMVNEVRKYFNIADPKKSRPIKAPPKSRHPEKPGSGFGKAKHQGKAIARTKNIKKKGFEKETVKKFLNPIIGVSRPGSGRRRKADKVDWMSLLSDPKWRPGFREKYSNYIFIIDEVHTFRYANVLKDGIGDKQDYEYLMAILDTIRDICPIILMTATPIVDTWTDLVSIIGLTLPKDKRQVMFDRLRQYANEKFPSGAALDNISNIITEYAYGIVSDRSSDNVVPIVKTLPFMIGDEKIEGSKFHTIPEEGENPILINENLYFTYMSDYQKNQIDDLLSRRYSGVQKTVNLDNVLTNLKDQTNTIDDTDIGSKDDMRGTAYNDLRRLYEFAMPMTTKSSVYEYTLSYGLFNIQLSDILTSLNVDITFPIYDSTYILFENGEAFRKMLSSILMSVNEDEDDNLYFDTLTPEIASIFQDMIDEGDEYILLDDLITFVSIDGEVVPDLDQIDQIKTILANYGALNREYIEDSIVIDSPDKLVRYDPVGRKFVPTDLAIRNVTTSRGVESENIFKIYYEDDGISMRMDIGLAKYSIKYATIIDLVKRNPQLSTSMGYFHTIWVKWGTKLISAALISNGWDQYDNITDPQTLDNSPRFAVIHSFGQTDHSSATSNILELASSVNNRNGEKLQIIVGSKKSAVSLSFTNAKFFFELSPDFNKSTGIQSRGRVLRANSLSWLKGADRFVYVMDVLAMPKPKCPDLIEDLQNRLIINKTYDCDDEQINPFTIEVAMYLTAQRKYHVNEQLMTRLREISIETIIKSPDTQDMIYDIHNYELLYSDRKIMEREATIRDYISSSWNFPYSSKMIDLFAIANLISSYTMIPNRYGKICPITAMEDGISLHSNSKDHTSIIYDIIFFIDEPYVNLSLIQDTIKVVLLLPNDETVFKVKMCKIDNRLKICALELAIASIKVRSSVYNIPSPKREWILDLFNLFWSYDPKTSQLYHILWYSVIGSSHLKKTGTFNLKNIVSECEHETRTLRADMKKFNKEEEINSRWTSVSSLDQEKFYLTYLGTYISVMEDNRIQAAKELGSNYYFYLSLQDGELRMRDYGVSSIGRLTDKRTIRSYVVGEANFPMACRETIESLTEVDYDTLLTSPRGIVAELLDYEDIQSILVVR